MGFAPGGSFELSGYALVFKPGHTRHGHLVRASAVFQSQRHRNCQRPGRVVVFPGHNYDGPDLASEAQVNDENVTNLRGRNHPRWSTFHSAVSRQRGYHPGLLTDSRVCCRFWQSGSQTCAQFLRGMCPDRRSLSWPSSTSVALLDIEKARSCFKVLAAGSESVFTPSGRTPRSNPSF